MDLCCIYILLLVINCIFLYQKRGLDESVVLLPPQTKNLNLNFKLEAHLYKLGGVVGLHCCPPVTLLQFFSIVFTHLANHGSTSSNAHIYFAQQESFLANGLTISH